MDFIIYTTNTLDCDQSNYSLCIVFWYIPIEFGQTGNSAIGSANSKNRTLEPNMKWIGWPTVEMLSFDILQMRSWSLVSHQYIY